MLGKIPVQFAGDREIEKMCHLLIKAQVPYFSEKMKDFSKAMKIISQIYCKYPVSIQQKQTTPQQRLKLRLKIRQQDLPITQSAEIKNTHIQFNNRNYWKSEHEEAQMQKFNQTNEDVQLWLQNNVWGYLD